MEIVKVTLRDSWGDVLRTRYMTYHAAILLFVRNPTRVEIVIN